MSDVDVETGTKYFGIAPGGKKTKRHRLIIQGEKKQMSDLDSEKRTRAFSPKKRRHRHTRREDKQHQKASDGRSERLRNRDQNRYHQDTVEEALDGKTPIDEPQDEDIKPDWQALRRHGSSKPARPQGELEALADRKLTEEQRQERRQVKAEKFFGRGKRKTKL